MSLRSLRSSKSREQKKEAPSRPSASSLFAIVCAMALFPVPASPFNHKTGDLSGPLVQSSISPRTVSQVPFRQPPRSPSRYPAPCAQWKLARTNASAIATSCQASVVESGDGLTWTLPREVISFVPSRTREGKAYYQLTSSVVISLLLGNLVTSSTRMGLSRSWTNPVIDYGLL